MTLSGTSAVCTVFTLLFSGSPLIYSPAPRGVCQNCCKINEAKDIKFLLYTRSNPMKADSLYVSDITGMGHTHFNKTLPVIIYLHGFSEKVYTGDEGQSSQTMKNAFLEKGFFNVILVDWSPISASPWYVSSINNIPRVGRYLARFIRTLIQSDYPLENIHLIGFSLGAEVSGFAGKILKEWGYILPRITGLDPVYPLHQLIEPSDRLSPNDADFVDIIHTDGGILGYPYPLGDVDFFPNKGSSQPGCFEQEIAKNRWLSIIIGCSHQRAWEYFVESVKRPHAFLGTSCTPRDASDTYNPENDCNRKISPYMGYDADPKLRGNYYLTTNSETPFGKNFEI